jgi:hypothetical protein
MSTCIPNTITNFTSLSDPVVGGYLYLGLSSVSMNAIHFDVIIFQLPMEFLCSFLALHKDQHWGLQALQACPLSNF